MKLQIGKDIRTMKKKERKRRNYIRSKKDIKKRYGIQKELWKEKDFTDSERITDFWFYNKQILTN